MITFVVPSFRLASVSRIVESIQALQLPPGLRTRILVPAGGRVQFGTESYSGPIPTTGGVMLVCDDLVTAEQVERALMALVPRSDAQLLDYMLAGSSQPRANDLGSRSAA